MLSKKERKVMRILFLRCSDKPSALVSPQSIKNQCEELSVSEIDGIVKALSQDGYYDLIYSERQGEKVYCISFSEKGKGFLRSEKVFKRNLAYRFGLTFVFALLSFVIGLVLKAIF